MWTEFYSSYITPDKLIEIFGKGADPNGYEGDSVMDPPLHTCCVRGDSLQIMEILLQHGADPNLISIRYSAFHLAARRGDVERIRLLLRYGADPDLQDTHGCTALVLATPFPPAVRLLLEHGVEIELRTKRGETALELAEERFPESERLLRKVTKE
jgi:ankyrin repeat protein